MRVLQEWGMSWTDNPKNWSKEGEKTGPSKAGNALVTIGSP